MNTNLFIITVTCLFLSARVSYSQEIDQSKGIDSNLVYESLTNFGPWDDRNYKLTTKDLEFLSPNEQELKEPIPAFFRVLLRKNYPNLPKTGPAQYPRSALQIFFQEYGGYLYDSCLYQNVIIEDGRYIIDEKECIFYNTWLKSKQE